MEARAKVEERSRQEAEAKARQQEPKPQLAPAQGFAVSGCGEARFVGTYWSDSGAIHTQTPGCSRPFKQLGGAGTLEYNSDGYWQLTERYGEKTFYACDSTSTTPPLTGWEAPWGGGTTPPPSLTPTTKKSMPAGAATE